jgi:DNA-binding MarR family transcriptional regulator
MLYPMASDDEVPQNYSIGILLRQAHRKAATTFAEALEPLGIAGRHFGILHVLNQSGPLSQRELVDKVASDKASMVRSIDDLEARGLAIRRPTPGDRRVRSVEITDDGRKTLAEAQQIARLVTARLLKHLEPAKRDQLTALLAEFVRSAS